MIHGTLNGVNLQMEAVDENFNDSGLKWASSTHRPDTIAGRCH